MPFSTISADPQQSIIFHSRELRLKRHNESLAARSKAIVTGKSFFSKPKNVRLSATRIARIWSHEMDS